MKSDSINMNAKLPLEYFRQPEYTGDNRCEICTAVNLVIAAGVVVIVATVSLPIASMFFIFSLSMIWLRGYLVPATPELTKRYFPARVLELFGKSGYNYSSEFDAESMLREIDVIASCSDEDDLCLACDFENNWQKEYSELTGDGDIESRRLSALLNSDETVVDDEESMCVVYADGVPAIARESHAALRADLAAMPELRNRLADWDDLDPVERCSLLSGLRIFLDFCPECGGSLVFSEGTVESCCRSFNAISLFCESCETRFAEIEQ